MAIYDMKARLQLFPEKTHIAETPDGKQLTIAGHDLSELAGRFGTPLYTVDQATLEAAVAEFRRSLAGYYPGKSGITYAGKAFLCLALAQWAGHRGLWIDCTGVGELKIAVEAGVPKEQILVHGVNKSPDDLTAAVAQAGTIVVDNLAELDRLVHMSRDDPLPNLWLRFRPGTAVVTHAYTQTGQDDSKFGMSGDEIVAAARICQAHQLPLNGLHFHQGSHFRDPTPIKDALEKTLDLMIEVQLEEPWVICPGGGLGVAYHEDDLPGPSISEYVRFVAGNLAAGCRQSGIPFPRLQMEPGRSLVARAGVALYRAGVVKHTPHRRWILLDGGMADNPRPALYGARYSALPVREPGRPATTPAWLAGPYCESGDILIEALPLPEVEPGELIAIPMSGAYHLSMASNYNGARRPAVLWLADGSANLIQEREIPSDLVRRDKFLPTKDVQRFPRAKRPPRQLPFAKYHALGNDYLVLPADIELTEKQIINICRVHTGIGADGLLVRAAGRAGADFALRVLNPDGSEAETSGNGLRIFSAYLWDKRLVRQAPFTLWTAGGLVLSRVHDGGRLVTVEMGQARFNSRHIPVTGPARDVIDETLVMDGKTLRFCAVTKGNPHCVILRAELSEAEARQWGPAIEKDPRFPNRTNVQFLKIIDRSNLQIKIWERGAGYTLASGSSSCAAAAVAFRLGLCDPHVTVHMPGGQLDVTIGQDYTISMTGPVSRVCQGTIAAELLGGAIE